MLSKFAKNLQHFLPLVGVFVAGVVGFYLFSYDRLLQQILIVAVSVSYVVWGLVHHYVHDDLNFTVVFEYVALGILGIVIIFSLIFRA